MAYEAMGSIWKTKMKELMNNLFIELKDNFWEFIRWGVLSYFLSIIILAFFNKSFEFVDIIVLMVFILLFVVVIKNKDKDPRKTLFNR